MVTLTTSHKNPRRKFRKFNREKVVKLLEQAPKFFIFHRSARCHFNGETRVLNPDTHLNLGKYGRFALVAFDGSSAIIMHRARRQKNDRFISIRNNKNVKIGHGMFIEEC